ncbi:MAG: hypothetical protein Q8K64_01250 [Sediminibacterium sp.]|nr:hypothetical protein [Sediminibacterium sp.]
MNTHNKGLKSFLQTIFGNRITRISNEKKPVNISRLTNSAANLILSREDLQKLECKTVRKYQLYAVKNMLVFSCFSGLMPEELMKLKKSNIKVLPDGSKVIEVMRINGIPNSFIPVTKKMELILHYYNGHYKNARGGKLFPTYCNDDINECLTYLSAYCGIYKPLTFLLARRTYVIHEVLNGTSIDNLKLNLGHKEAKSTRRYIKELMREIYGETKSTSLLVKSPNYGK